MDAGPCPIPDQVVRSQPISIILLTQSCGKYDLHSRIFATERILVTPNVRWAMLVALSERGTCGTAKIRTRDEVSKFIALLLRAC
jgi:hypothetical protein